MSDIVLDEGRFDSHLHMKDEGIRIDSFRINCPNHIKHGQRIVRIIRTPKLSEYEWGTGVVTFAMQDEEKEYKTINGLLADNGLPLLPVKKKK